MQAVNLRVKRSMLNDLKKMSVMRKPPDDPGKKIRRTTLQSRTLWRKKNAATPKSQNSRTNALQVLQQPSPVKDVKMDEQSKAHSDQLQHHTSLYTNENLIL